MPDNSQIAVAVQADIDALRERFPRTSDLYREACSIMFFRYGLTPTTNALYQFVRKGSMSVPNEALRRFWSDLRERARPDASGPSPTRRSASCSQLSRLSSLNIRRDSVSINTSVVPKAIDVMSRP
ncbi:DNA-binding protein [Massilia sp. NP310]|jgi:hypothetical protein|nr:DNA-binding protein [Massilia sp. NP310]